MAVQVFKYKFSNDADYYFRKRGCHAERTRARRPPARPDTTPQPGVASPRTPSTWRRTGGGNRRSLRRRETSWARWVLGLQRRLRVQRTWLRPDPSAFPEANCVFKN